MRIHRRSNAIGALLTLGLLLSACSGLPGLPAQRSEPPPPPTSAPSGNPSGASQAPSAAPSGSPDPSTTPSSAPAATRDASIRSNKLRLTLYPIRRADTLAVLDFTISWPKSAGTSSSDYLALNSDLGDNNLKTGDRNSFNASDGVRLVDNVNRKLYLAASDQTGDCVCSRDLGRIALRPGDTAPLFTTFAAPPAGVTALDVTVPGFGLVRDVPVA